MGVDSSVTEALKSLEPLRTQAGRQKIARTIAEGLDPAGDLASFVMWTQRLSKEIDPLFKGRILEWAAGVCDRVRCLLAPRRRYAIMSQDQLDMPIEGGSAMCETVAELERDYDLSLHSITTVYLPAETVHG